MIWMLLDKKSLSMFLWKNVDLIEIRNIKSSTWHLIVKLIGFHLNDSIDNDFDWYCN